MPMRVFRTGDQNKTQYWWYICGRIALFLPRLLLLSPAAGWVDFCCLRALRPPPRWNGAQSDKVRCKPGLTGSFQGSWLRPPAGTSLLLGFHFWFWPAAPYLPPARSRSSASPALPLRSSYRTSKKYSYSYKIHVNQCNKYRNNTHIYINLCENYWTSYKHTCKSMHEFWKQHKHVYKSMCKTIDVHTSIHVNPCNKYGINRNVNINQC